MSTWIVWWLLLSLVTTMALIVLLFALGRHALSVGRAARRFADEVRPLTDQIGAGSSRASERGAHLEVPRS